MSGLTKFFYHDMKGAPTLKAEWGSLLSVIRAVALDGFNEQGIDTISILDGVATVNFPVPHGFIEHQVISVSGANEVLFNREYRVISVTENTITFNTQFSELVTGTILVKTAGMGWTEKFSGENKAVFTAKDTVKNPFYLRVDNSCPVGYDTTWGKFARVTISNGINDIDNYDGFEKAPTSPQHPNTNENGDGVSGETGIFGWAKWYHGVETYQYLREKWNYQTVSNIPKVLKWEIVGDDSNIYMFIQNTDIAGRVIYTFTPIQVFNSTDSMNCFLSYTDGLRAANQNGEYYVTGRTSANCHWKSLDSSGKLMLRDYTGIGNHVNCGVFSLNVDNNQQYSGLSESIPSPDKISNSMVLGDVYIKTNNGIRGKLDGIKWINNKWYYGNRVVIKKGESNFIMMGVYSQYGDTFFAMELK